MFTALEKLYGLKLSDGLITEDKIPDRYKENAIAYYESLKPTVEEETTVDETNTEENESTDGTEETEVNQDELEEDSNINIKDEEESNTDVNSESTENV